MTEGWIVGLIIGLIIGFILGMLFAYTDIFVDKLEKPTSPRKRKPRIT